MQQFRKSKWNELNKNSIQWRMDNKQSSVTIFQMCVYTVVLSAILECWPFRLDRGRFRRPSKSRRVCISSERNVKSGIGRVPIARTSGDILTCQDIWRGLSKLVSMNKRFKQHPNLKYYLLMYIVHLLCLMNKYCLNQTTPFSPDIV